MLASKVVEEQMLQVQILTVLLHFLDRRFSSRTNAAALRSSPLTFGSFK
jgi:hypothetical protein